MCVCVCMDIRYTKSFLICKRVMPENIYNYQQLTNSECYQNIGRLDIYSAKYLFKSDRTIPKRHPLCSNCYQHVPHFWKAS